MLGFMKESGLEEYCIDVNELNADILWKKLIILLRTMMNMWVN